MGLREYFQKRDFAVTPEPRGRAHRAKTKGLLFVIQKHAASHLHYDFRLELEGVLKSWSVPKGPSLDPGERRLAMHVEDHPLEYGGFEGIIPKGEYGGGTVLLWDRGRWHPKGDPLEGYKKGRLSFELDGEKLHGGFVLVRMRGEDGRAWLLIKEKDEHARPRSKDEVTRTLVTSIDSGRTLEEIAAAQDRVWHSKKKETARGRERSTLRERLAKSAARAAAKPPRGAKKAAFPRDAAPQLATLVDAAPEGDDWLHELKLDGYRALAVKNGDTVRMITRNGLDWTSSFEVPARAVAALPAKQAILDGEVVVYDEKGITSFQALQNAFGRGSAASLVYCAFDLLYLDGHDLRGLPLAERKESLARLLRAQRAPALRYSDHVVGGGPDVHAEACKRGLEGIVSKRADSPYRAGRTREWLKTKCALRQELVIAGFTEPRGANVGLGALLLGAYEGGALRYAGKVGTGFSTALRKELRARLEALERKTPPFDPKPSGLGRGVHFVEPELVGEIQLTGWTDDGRARHPSFQGLRADKAPKSVTRERALPVETALSVDRGSKTRRPRRATKAVQAKKNEEAAIYGMRISNPQRVLWPEDGITKRELAEYAAAIADHMLPYVERRPLALVRCPEGHGGECFFQKHPMVALPKEVHDAPLREAKGRSRCLYVDDAPGLVALAQVNTLEVHAWNSRLDAVERPDQLILDLDPAPDVPWPRVVAAARMLRKRLASIELESYVKTTGGKGLHVVVPIAPEHGWDVVKDFSHALARAAVRDEPKLYTANMSKERRGGKIFLDYLRNARGATAIAPYSTRRRPGAPVAMPLRWEELGKLRGGGAFDLRNTPARLARQRRDPWDGFLKNRQSLAAALRAFTKLLEG